jgi:hypothetical protein
MPSEGHARGSVDRRTRLRCCRLAVTRPCAYNDANSNTSPHTRPVCAIFWEILLCWHSCEVLAARDTMKHDMGHCSSNLVDLRRAASDAIAINGVFKGRFQDRPGYGTKRSNLGANWQFVHSGQPQGPLRWPGRLCAHLEAPNKPTKTNPVHTHKQGRQGFQKLSRKPANSSAGRRAPGRWIWAVYMGRLQP